MVYTTYAAWSMNNRPDLERKIQHLHSFTPFSCTWIPNRIKERTWLAMFTTKHSPKQYAIDQAASAVYKLQSKEVTVN